jgi:hypothetical protein
MKCKVKSLGTGSNYYEAGYLVQVQSRKKGNKCINWKSSILLKRIHVELPSLTVIKMRKLTTHPNPY